MMVVKRSTLRLASAPLLGEGEFAKVFKVTLQGQAYALKQANPSNVAKAALAKERAVLEACAHPNIIGLEAVADDGRCLVLELCPGGTLEDRLQTTRGRRSKSRGKSRRQTMPARRIVQISLELMRAVQCMHDKGLCHGDVKSANILLATKAVTASAAGVRLADMGFSRTIGSAVSDEDGGSAPFICRELQLGLDSVSRAAHDIFACGVVMLDLACTQKPYEDLSVREFDTAVEEGTLYSRGTVPLAEFKNKAAFEQFASLFFEMLSHNPEERPTASDAVKRLEEIAAALDGQKQVSRGARPDQAATFAMADDDDAYASDAACLASEPHSFVRESLTSSVPAPEAGMHLHWGQQRTHDERVTALLAHGAEPVLASRFCDAAGGPADHFLHACPEESVSQSPFSHIAPSVPQQEAYIHAPRASVHKDVLWCDAATCCDEGEQLNSEGGACQMLNLQGESGSAGGGDPVYSGGYEQLHQAGQLHTGAAAVAAEDGFWCCGGGAQSSTSFYAYTPLRSLASPRTSPAQITGYGNHCLHSLPMMGIDEGESESACRGFGMWSNNLGEGQCTFPSMQSARGFRAVEDAFAPPGGSYFESQSAVQPGWAPSHLEELSPRNAISEALAVSPYKQQAIDRQPVFAPPKKEHDAHGDCCLDWSPW